MSNGNKNPTGMGVKKLEREKLDIINKATLLGSFA